MSVGNLLARTKNFIIMRVAAGAVLLVASIVLIAMFIGVMNLAPNLAFFWIMLWAAFFIVGYRVFFRLLLYMIKVGHTAAITELLRDGASSSENLSVGQTVVWSKDIIKKYLGEAVGSAAVGFIITGAVRQVMRFVNMGLNLLSFLPFMKNIQKFINSIMYILVGAVDCSILSYIIWNNDERNSFKKGCDALVLFAQSWKGMLKGALKVVLSLYGINIVCVIIGVVIGSALSNFLGAGAFFVIIMLVAIINVTLTQPFTMIVMMKAYHKSIEGLHPAVDIHEKLSKFSRKFRTLAENANDIGPRPAVI